MPQSLDTPANEESTYPVVVTFRDEAGTLMTPTAATWTLTALDGTVINGRSAVTMTPLSTSYTIVLSGDDLSLPVGRGNERCLLVQGTYTSSLGAGLPFTEEIRFEVAELVGVV